MNRQKTVLFILVLLLIAAGLYSYFRIPRQKTVDTLKYSPGAATPAAKAEAARSDERKLHLELLDVKQPTFTGFKRNIFWLPSHSTIKKLPPPPPPPPYRPPTPPVQPAPSTPPAPISPVRAEMAKFTFLGFLKKDDKKTIFLAKENEILLVKKGDKIANNYQVTNITDEALTINPVSGEGQIVIPLVENMPLSAPGK